MKLAIACDHAGLDVKQTLIEELGAAGHTMIDLGCHGTESVDYPDYARAVALALSRGEAERGILICGTGLGMSIAANRFKGIRAALCTSPDLARLAREHNDANIVCVGARTQEIDAIREIIRIWLETEWADGRHGLRIEKLDRE